MQWHWNDYSISETRACKHSLVHARRQLALSSCQHSVMPHISLYPWCSTEHSNILQYHQWCIGAKSYPKLFCNALFLFKGVCKVNCHVNSRFTTSSIKRRGCRFLKMPSNLYRYRVGQPQLLLGAGLLNFSLPCVCPGSGPKGGACTQRC